MRSSPVAFVPLNEEHGAACVIGVQSGQYPYLCSYSFASPFVAEGVSTVDDSFQLDFQSSPCNIIQHIYAVKQQTKSDNSDVAIRAMLILSDLRNERVALRRQMLDYVFAPFPQQRWNRQGFQQIGEKNTNVIGMKASECGKTVIVVSRDTVSLSTQATVFEWNCSDSPELTICNSFNISSPILGVNINAKGDEMQFVTQSTISTRHLSLLRWSPFANIVNEEDLGIAIGDDTVLDNRSFTVMFWDSKPKITSKTFSSTVFLVCLASRGASNLQFSIGSPMKPRQSQTRLQPSGDSNSRLYWCYKRNVKYDFAGAMYPVGYRLVMESYLYHEKEDEFDRIEQVPVCKNSFPTLENLPVRKPSQARKELRRWLPYTETFNFLHLEMSSGKTSLDISSRASIGQADILPILSTCRINIVGGALQIKPPSKCRLALEEWISSPSSSELCQFSLPDIANMSVSRPLSTKTQRIVNIANAIESICLNEKELSRRKTDIECTIVERTVKAEYHAAIRKVRTKERFLAKQQNKQNLLMSLLKSNEEEKRKRWIQEQDIKREVSSVIDHIIQNIEAVSALSIEKD